jgi:Zn finger protein HypA/HybF involved in hydrogenase expression
MPYFQCRDCHKTVRIDTDQRETYPVCGSENGEVLMDEEHHEAVKEGLIFHEDTD